MRILNLDIECAPALVYTWDLNPRYITPEKIVQPKRMLCFAGKWVGEDDIHFFSEWDDGAGMLEKAWKLLDEADAVLHYNGRRFDIPYINSEFAIAGMPPPSPYGQIDLYKAVRKQFAFMSNSLDSVSKLLGTERKLGNEGFSLWVKVMEGDRMARLKMEEYNCHDIFANESLYERLIPWLPSHPSYAVTDGNADCCPQCGEPGLLPEGYAYTAVSKYQRYKCNQCGSWARDTRRISGASVRTA